MKAEYKRDLSGNYLVLYEEEEPDTSSYQMRMLVGNTIPSVLKCRVQGVDGHEDLQMILGGFVQVMEEMAEYLLNPSRLLLKPEYMYVDVEKRQLYFCYLPGYDQDVRQEFQELTEYILPLLDHEDTEYTEERWRTAFIWNTLNRNYTRNVLRLPKQTRP